MKKNAFSGGVIISTNPLPSHILVFIILKKIFFILYNIYIYIYIYIYKYIYMYIYGTKSRKPRSKNDNNS